MYTLQNFYKATITSDWSIGTGNFYVSEKPEVEAGWVVISPNNATLREIVKYTATGTDSDGDYITISERGVGGTTEQTHSTGEPVRMNITAEYWADMNDDIADIVASGVPDANTTTMGGVEIATDAEVMAETDVGGTGATLVVTPSQVKLAGNPTPTVRVYKATNLGDTTTQFDITNPAGTTFRYTWDTTGTDPGITAVTVPVGASVLLFNTSMSAANIGNFTVTGSGTNYFEVTNASGAAETNRTLGNGLLQVCVPATWTKPTGLKYVEVELVGGGGGGAGTTNSNACAGGGGGGYSRKTISASSLGATEAVTIGHGGAGGPNTGGDGIVGGTSSFGAHLQATGGGGGSGSNISVGGIGTLGDFNINGGSGGTGITDAAFCVTGKGGDSILGHGAKNDYSSSGVDGTYGSLFGGGGSGGANDQADSSDRRGGPGAGGVVIVKEYL